MGKTVNVVICKNCGNKFEGNYCNICGQKIINNRFTFGVFFKDAIENIFNLESGFFFTIQQLLLNPDKTIKEYLSGRTKVYFNPIKFLLVIAGISALFVIISKTYDNSIQLTTNLTNNLIEQSEELPPFAIKLMAFLKTYLNVIMIIIVPFYAFSFKLLFFRTKLYYTEHLIINCYAFGIGHLLSIIVSFIFLFIPNSTAIDMVSGFIILLAVYIYFYQRITERKLLGTILFSIFSMVIGFLLFVVIFNLLIFVTVFIVKKYTHLL